MRAAVALLLTAIALGVARASATPPVSMLGLVYTASSGTSALGRFDPVTLDPLPGPSVTVRTNVGSWAFSPDGRLLALAGTSLVLRLVDVDAMAAIGEIRLASRGGTVNGVSWVRPDRVLALVNTPDGVLVVAVDPISRQVIRRTQLSRPFGFALGRFPNGIAFLLDSIGRFAAAQVAVVDADGRVRIATIPGVSLGTVQRRTGSDLVVRRRGGGLAVDPSGRRAYLVGAGARIAVVDLDTLAVSYGGPLREVAKALEGSFRVARWLGTGRIAVSGTDYRTANGRMSPMPSSTFRAVPSSDATRLFTRSGVR